MPWPYRTSTEPGAGREDHRSWLTWFTSRAALFELLLSLTAIGIALWTNVRSNHLQADLARQQVASQDRAADAEHRNNLLSIISSNLGSIDLRTPSGRAAFAICLNAAVQLDSAKGGFRYMSLLPKYDPHHLEMYLADDPELLAFAREHGPKVAPLSDRKGFYVVVGTYRRPSKAAIDDARESVRNILDQSPSTSILSVSVLEVRGRREEFVMVVGQQMTLGRAERYSRQLATATRRSVYLISADRVVRMGMG